MHNPVDYCRRGRSSYRAYRESLCPSSALLVIAGKPAWVRQVGLIPCDCKRCFFCTTGRTTGITHKPLKRTREGALPRGHDKERETVALNTRRCKLCNEQPKKKNMSSAEKRRQQHRTKLGCRACDACVCTECWHLFVHINNN
jgi:hypothetical protein